MTPPKLAEFVDDARHFLRQLRDTPHIARESVDVKIGMLRAALMFRNARRGARLSVTGAMRVVLQGDVEIGDHVLFMGGMIPSELICHRGAAVAIGDDSSFNYGVSIDARSAIRIGNRCMFGQMVRLADYDHDRTKPIVLGDDVWVAHGAIIGPGVTIGNGSVVSAGSVVTGDVAAGMLAIGNPARCLRQDLSHR